MLATHSMGAVANRTVPDLGPLVGNGALSVTPTGIVLLGFEARIRKSRSDRNERCDGGGGKEQFSCDGLTEHV